MNDPSGSSAGRGWVPWAVLVAVGCWLRLARTASMPLFGDEYHTLPTLAMSYGEVLRLFDSVGSHVALPLIQKAAADLFGDGIVVNRLVAIVPGIAALALLYPLGRHLVGGAPALIATAFFALSPMHVFYSRFARGYALSLLLSLLLVDAVRRASASGSPRHWAAVALWTALLPYVHLTSLGLIAAVAAVALGLALFGEGPGERGGPRALLAPIAAFGLGGALCAAMYLPAWESLQDYLGKIKGEGYTEALRLLDIPTILAGGRAAGAVWLVCVPLGGLLFLLRDPGRAALCLAPIAGPLLFTVVFKPNGMAYAYARYLHVGLPFMVLLLGWLLVFAARRCGLRREGPAVLAGCALAAAAYVAGPRSFLHPDNGPYDNTYLALHRLPAFDAPFDETPEIYRQLAQDPSVTRIIESPPMGSRSILLYRNYFLQHGKQTLFGLLTPSNETLVRGPYVRVFDRELDASSEAQYLIVHMDVDAETARYWSFVYNFVWNRARVPAEASFMIRHLAYLAPPGAIDPKTLRPLSRRFGKPVFVDERVRVWDLRNRVDEQE